MNETLNKVLNGAQDNHILPFFWQHGESEETLRKYVRVIHDANIGALCVESRPHPDFCGPKWWQDMDAIIDESKKLGMKVWILDDAHFPTGYANGALKDEDAFFRRRSLTVKYLDVPETGICINLADYKEADPWAHNMVEGYIMGSEAPRVVPGDKLEAVVAVRTTPTAQDGDGDGIDPICYDLTDSKNGVVIFRAPEGTSASDWKIAVIHTTCNRGPHRDYINMMDRGSVHKLIEAVYEPHFEHYGDEFGKTVAGFFSDEPEIGNGHLYEFGKKIGDLDDQAWSDAVEARLKGEWGAHYRANLPFIWTQAAGRDTQARVRCDYMDAVTLEVQKCFSMQLGDWCRDHGVKYIGHLIEDDHQHTRTCSSLGHFFRGLAGQDWAGVDDIGGQVLPQGEHVGKGDFMHPVRDGEFWHYTLGKLASSMAAIDPLKHGEAMCEIFGNYSWSEGVRLEKYLADHLMVRGINNYVPHAFTPAPFPDPDCPPHFYAHGHNPQYRHFGALMTYMNRVCTLISGGHPVIPAAVLYNAEADWAGEYMYLQKPGIELYDHQIDYHFIPNDAFVTAEDTTPVEDPDLVAQCDHPIRWGMVDYGAVLDKPLSVNGQEYDALVIPYMQYIPEAAACAALALSNMELPVIFVDALPEAVVESGRGDSLVTRLKEAAKLWTGAPESGRQLYVVPLDQLAEALIALGVKDAVISPANDRIRIYHYVSDTEFYMVVNEGVETWTGEVTVPGAHAVSLYDAWFNTLTAADAEIKAGAENASAGTTSVKISLEPRKSIFLILDGSAAEAADKETAAGKEAAADDETAAGCACGIPETTECIDLASGWTRSICKSLDYPAFAGEKEISLPDTLAEEQPEFSGFVRYERTLDCGDKVPAHAVLEISDAYEGVEVFVNGESLGIQIVPTFCYDLAPALKAGRNELRIEVATTLEREAVSFPNRWASLGVPQEAPTVPSGINGGVTLKMW